MDDTDLRAKLLTTPFVSSWVGRARAGDRFDQDPRRRSAAWAHWAVTSMTQMTGGRGRAYPALVLDGKFHDPRGTGPLIRPHIEIPEHVLERGDPEFPERLAQMGNGLAFAWWVPAEATATKRCLWNTYRGELSEFCQMLESRRANLIEAMIKLSRAAASRWGDVEAALVQDAEVFSEEITADFTSADVSDFVPAAAAANITIVFDAKLRERSGRAAARRVGVWQLAGLTSDGTKFSLGVVTPRLTASSQFRDRHFAIERESSTALLVRGLLLRRILVGRLGAELGDDGVVGEPKPQRARPEAFLRAVVPKVGDKIPEASTSSAVLFLQTHDDADEAWDVLTSWAERSKALLTVNEDGFKAAHRRASMYLRRAEELDREDINVLLPLAWDDSSRVVRLTFSRRAGSAQR